MRDEIKIPPAQEHKESTEGGRAKEAALKIAKPI